MELEPFIKEIFTNNPLLNRDKVERVVKTLQHLEKAGVKENQYGLMGRSSRMHVRSKVEKQ